MTKKVLGKGLQALIPEPYQDLLDDSRQVVEIELSRIRPNPYQPRADMNREGLEELKQSIRENGILQPLIVQREGDGYILIAGERRLQAAQEAGKKTVPVLVIKVSGPRQMLELSLIENIQRENLNAIDQARAYKRLMDEFSLTQEEVAHKVGKDRSTVANMLRLLHLPSSVQDELRGGVISVGHARALLALSRKEDQVSICEKIVKRGLSVRRIEELVRNIVQDQTLVKDRRGPKKPVQVLALEERLRQTLGTQVRIKQSLDRGKIEIEFYSSEDLDRLIELLLGASRS